MRFGHDFHRYIIPEFHDEYIDYNLLKRLAKTPSDGKAIEGLRDYHPRVTSFLRRRRMIWDQEKTALTDMFDIERAAITHVSELCPFELTLLLEAFHELRQDLQKLIWFYRVNAEAVTRILNKLKRRHRVDGGTLIATADVWQNWRAHWDSQLQTRLEDISRILSAAEKGLSASPERTTGKSMYLPGTFDPLPWSEQLTAEITLAIQSGDFNFVVEAIASDSSLPTVSQEELEAIAGDLCRYAVMLWPEQAKSFLLLHPSPEDFLIDNEILKWGILAMGRRTKLDARPEITTHRVHHSPVGFQHLYDLLDACADGRSAVLLAQDEIHRLPAHYAAMYDLPWLDRTSNLNHFFRLFLVPSADDGADEDANKACFNTIRRSQDLNGLTLLDLAVISNCKDTFEAVSQASSLLGRHPRSTWVEAAGRSLFVSLLDPDTTISPVELASGMDGIDGLKSSGRDNEFLRAAARVGSGVELFLGDKDADSDYYSDDAPGDYGQNECADERGWSLLFHACAQGHYDVVEYLLGHARSPASQTRTDDLGWTAKEYAVLNGHLAVGALFEPAPPGDMTDGPGRMPTDKITHPRLHCEEGERIIIASLGSERVNAPVTEVDLSFCSSKYSPRKFDGLHYALEITAAGTTGKPRRVQLPILDDQINDPFVFPIPAVGEPLLMFEVLCWGSDENEVEIAGQGIAMLECNARQFGPGRQSLIREQTIPIIEDEILTSAGTVTFTYMVVNHFPHLQTPREVDLVRKPVEPPLLVGHRGLGMNLRTHEYLQIGENTVESFVSAAKLGASFVEFDVQVTKDHEAVIFHDFSLSESGTDVPIHDLTLNQFRYASNIQSPHGNPLSVLGPTHSRDEPGRSRQRSRSVGGHFEAGAIQVRDRMKHTVDFKLKGYKPNTRGDFIQDTFATLKELLAQVPEDVGFDIEIKYPRLHEATAANVAPVAIDLNTFVDTALLALHEHAGTSNRRIILSSFTPEICMLLSIKQKAYPVFFITNAGKVPMSDMERRAASVKVAVRFAQRWNLTGVVFACEAMLLCPRLVGYVKNRGLVCATYGTLNNVPENVQVQVEAGVDVIIADRVGLVARTLAEGRGLS